MLLAIAWGFSVYWIFHEILPKWRHRSAEEDPCAAEQDLLTAIATSSLNFTTNITTSSAINTSHGLTNQQEAMGQPGEDTGRPIDDRGP